MKIVLAAVTRVQTPVLLICLTLFTGVIGYSSGITISRVALNALISLVFVVGLFIFSGNSGVMSFGHVAFMAIGAYATAYLIIPVPLKSSLFDQLPNGLGFLAQVHAPYLLALVLSGVVAALAGLLTAPIVARLSGLQSGIVTLALLIIVYNVCNGWTSVTRGSSSMIGIPGDTTITIALVIAIVAVLVAWLYKESRSGLQLRASRDDYLAAVAAGVAVGRHRAIAWVLSAFLCGIAGGLYAAFLLSFNISDFYLEATFAFITMIVVGGYLSLSGAVIGTLVISVLQEFLRRLQDGDFTGGGALPAGVADLVLAAVLLGILIRAPLGICGVRELAVTGWRRARGSRSVAAQAAAPPPSSPKDQDAAKLARAD